MAKPADQTSMGMSGTSFTSTCNGSFSVAVLERGFVLNINGRITAQEEVDAVRAHFDLFLQNYRPVPF